MKPLSSFHSKTLRFGSSVVSTSGRYTIISGYTMESTPEFTPGSFMLGTVVSRCLNVLPSLSSRCSVTEAGTGLCSCPSGAVLSASAVTRWLVLCFLVLGT